MEQGHGSLGGVPTIQDHLGLRMTHTLPMTDQATRRRPLTGSRNWTITMPDELLAFLDAEAERRCCSRSAYLRWLIVQAKEARRGA